MTPEDILEAAQIIRLYLPDLLGPEADTVDRTLATLITRAEAGGAVDNQILALLAERDATREWSRQFFQDKIPPPVIRSYAPLEGSISRINAKTFICPVPNCPTTWYSPKAGMPPPLCPDHNQPLVPATPQTT